MDISRKYKEIQDISLAMFRKNFLGIHHGSLSAKISSNQFIINKKSATFDNLNQDNIALLYYKKDYRWNEASIDSDIHLNIYKNIPEAKYICFCMPLFTTAYTINHSNITPKDYSGAYNFPKIPIYDLKNFEDWQERAPYEIYRYMINNEINFIVIKGYGIFIYSRFLIDIVRSVAIIENSCQILKLLS